MKFLCVECDEAMRLERAEGPDHGSMTVIFACPSCGRRTAMLTNTMETQVVRSLGVKIGGRTVPAEPMEMVRGSLVASQSDEAHSPSLRVTSEAADVPSPGAPEHAVAAAHEVAPAEPAPASAGTAPAPESSKCPFTGMVNEAFAQQASVRWSEGARRRIDRIPEFARKMVMKGVEDTARARGVNEITETVLDDVRGQFGM